MHNEARRSELLADIERSVFNAHTEPGHMLEFAARKGRREYARALGDGSEGSQDRIRHAGPSSEINQDVARIGATRLRYHLRRRAMRGRVAYGGIRVEQRKNMHPF